LQNKILVPHAIINSSDDPHFYEIIQNVVSITFST